MKRSGAIVLMMMTALMARAEAQEFPLRAGFVLEGNPTVGAEFDLNFTAKAVGADVPAFLFSIEIPAGIEPLSDTASSVIDLQQGDSASRSFTMKTLKEGAYHIKSTLSFTEPEFEPLTEYYIVSGHDTALHNNEPFEGWVYNLAADTIPEEPGAFLPAEDGIVVQGRLRYYDRDEQVLVPVRGIRVKLYQSNGAHYLETATNDDGEYRLTPVPGTYYLQFDAANSAAEVHPFWGVVFQPGRVLTLGVSPNPHCFARILIKVQNPGTYEYNYDFTETERANWAKILRTVSEVRSKVSALTGGHTLSYLEVAYPGHKIGDWEPPSPFYAPVGMLRSAQVKWGIWWGFTVVYRSIHQIVVPKEHQIWGAKGKVGCPRSHGHSEW